RLGIDARTLEVGFLGALWEEIGEAHGTVDARVEVGGTRAAPRPSGWVKLEGGHLNFRHDQRRYQAALALRIEGERAILSRLQLGSDGGGTLTATGEARLDGLSPTALSLTAKAHRFEAAYGSASARFDADFDI